MSWVDGLIVLVTAAVCLIGLHDWSPTMRRLSERRATRRERRADLAAIHDADRRRQASRREAR